MRSNDSELIASVSDGKTVILSSAVIGKHLLEFRSYKSRVVALSLCCDSKLLASASDDNVMRLWNAVTREAVVLIFFALTGNHIAKYLPPNVGSRC